MTPLPFLAMWFFEPPAAGALLAAGAAFALSALGCWAARRIAVRFDWLDRPGGHKGHARPVPLGGGLAMAFAFFLVCGIGGASAFPPAATSEVHSPAPVDRPGSTDTTTHANAVAETTTHDSTTQIISSRRYVGCMTPTPEESRRPSRAGAILLGAAVLAVLGFFDDSGGLDWKFRLVVQTAVAGGTSWWLLGPASLLAHGAFVFWTVGLVNAFNMLDNMDGLSAGTAVAAAAGLACAAFSVWAPAPVSGGVAAAMGGAAAGFLLYNAPPARLYMGDAGAYLLGFVLAATAVEIGQAGLSASGAAWLFCGLFVVPWYDLVTVAAVRLAEGRSPFRGDQCHLSHRLVARGLSRPAAAGAIVLVAAFASAAGAARYVAGIGSGSAGGTLDHGAALAVAAALVVVGWWDVSAFLKSRRGAASIK